MAVLPILTHPDPRLRLAARPVERFDADLRRLVGDMTDTMFAAHGVGLAGPQVGASQRVVVIDVGRTADPDADDPRPEARPFVNPRIVEADGDLVWKEGCLSVPGVSAEVQRRARVVLTYDDLDGRPQRLEAKGLLAVCIQHELDHLDGTLYVDRLPPLEQKLTLADYEKARAAVPAGGAVR